MNFGNSNAQLLALGVFHQPQDLSCVFPVEILNRGLLQGARGRHPVERLIRAVVGMHGHGTVRFDDEQAVCHRQVGIQAAHVIY